MKRAKKNIKCGLGLGRRILPTQRMLNTALCAALTVVFASSSVHAQQAVAETQKKPDSNDLLIIRHRGESESVEKAESGQLQKDRRVEIAEASPGAVAARGSFVIDLPGGGTLWATEDPQLVPPQLSASSVSVAAYQDGQITEPVQFRVYNNYASFIESMEIVVYRGADADRVEPLATIPVPVNYVDTVTWDGKFKSSQRIRSGDDLMYIVRATGKDGGVDETRPMTLQLLRPEDAERAKRSARAELDGELAGLSDEQLLERQLTDDVFGQNALVQQNIVIYGSRVRIVGQDLPRQDYNVTINGETYPITADGRLAAEFLLPVGKHTFKVEAGDQNKRISRDLGVDVTGKYLFMVALADLTLSDNDVGDAVLPVGTDDNFDDMLTEGRLAFYLKGKVKGKYLITAQADSREREVRELFDGFLDPDPQDVFRRLDPDAYYPVYGDDSTTYRDVDTQGRLYVRVDWDKNQALWGNFATGMTNGEYAQYQRSLYGAALSWRSRSTTDLGEAKTQLRAFGSEQQTAPGHSEFIGTGGSLYYLRHTDILPGSDQVVLEVRDPLTGRVETRRNLIRDIDYDVDELQGRIILTRPLSQISGDNVPTLTRDAPLDGFQNILIADYEYIPTGFSADRLAAGFSGKQWFGDHFAVGGIYVEERRDGADYNLVGGDITLQAGRGTYVKVEQASSESTSAPVFFSYNGGLSFSQINPINALLREGDAKSLEARANLTELGWTQQDWAIGGWWREVDDGFSVARFDQGLSIEEYGAEVAGQFTEALRFSARYSNAERAADALEQANALLEWRINDYDALSGELRQVKETRAGFDADGTLAAIRYARRFTESFEGSITGQFTVDDDGGNYLDNDALTLGARYLFGDLSSVSAEISDGDRGQSANISGEYRLNDTHSLYAGYTWADEQSTDPLFNSRRPSGLTVGQRWRINNQTNLFNESQFLKERDSSGIAHSFGMDFYPGESWNLGFLLQTSELDNSVGVIDRDAISVSGGYTTPDVSWNSKLEWRRDTGVEQREQWVTTNRLLYRVNEDWRIAARINHSKTNDQLDARADARFTEANLGFAYRPAFNDRLNLLGKYTYLYDLSSLGQDTFADYDQRSQILSFEGIYRIAEHWELAGKLARREGEARLTRNAGPWFDSTATLAAGQLRYETTYGWDALAEYRWLNVDENDSTREGFLIGVDRHLGENFRVGVGYNFTDFSDDLTQLDFDHKGWFLNFTGIY